MIILHHCPQARSMRSFWLLGEIGVPHQVVTHDFSRLRTPEYLALNPLGRVPVLIDGDVTLAESGAICEYLCEQYDPGMLWRWPGHAERAPWLHWLHFAETQGQHLAALTQQHIMLHEDHQRSPIIMKLEKRRLEKTLEVLAAGLGDRPYLLAGGFSAVDTGVGYNLFIAQRFTDLSAFGALPEYLDRLSRRAAFRAAMPPPDAPLIYDKPFYAPWPM